MIMFVGLQVQQTHFTGKDVQEQTPFLSLQNECSQKPGRSEQTHTRACQMTTKLY
jgi:hypothetical protein